MATATGDLFKNEGEFDLDFTTQEGHKRRTTFQHGKVSMPIMSTGAMADHDHESHFQKHGGTITDMITKEVSHFIRCFGVYFIKLVVDEQILNPGLPFHRQGRKP